MLSFCNFLPTLKTICVFLVFSSRLSLNNFWCFYDHFIPCAFIIQIILSWAPEIWKKPPKNLHMVSSFSCSYLMFVQFHSPVGPLDNNQEWKTWPFSLSTPPLRGRLKPTGGSYHHPGEYQLTQSRLSVESGPHCSVPSWMFNLSGKPSVSVKFTMSISLAAMDYTPPHLSGTRQKMKWSYVLSPGKGHVNVPIILEEQFTNSSSNAKYLPYSPFITLYPSFTHNPRSTFTSALTCIVSAPQKCNTSMISANYREKPKSL